MLNLSEKHEVKEVIRYVDFERKTLGKSAVKPKTVVAVPTSKQLLKTAEEAEQDDKNELTELLGRINANRGDGELVDVDLQAFRPMFGECATHGKYPLNGLDARGREFWHPEECPHCKRQAKSERLLKGMNIPRRFADCTFDNYETPDLAQRKALAACRDYADNFAEYHDGGVSAIMMGNPGTGKNHLATAIARQLHEARYTVVRVKASEFIEMFWSLEFAGRGKWIQELAQVDLLILDEIGRSSDTKAANDAFFRLIDSRYEEKRPTLLLTNLNREGLEETLGNPAVDRLRDGGGKLLPFMWDSYRGAKA